MTHSWDMRILEFETNPNYFYLHCTYVESEPRGDKIIYIILLPEVMVWWFTEGLWKTCSKSVCIDVWIEWVNATHFFRCLCVYRNPHCSLCCCRSLACVKQEWERIKNISEADGKQVGVFLWMVGSRSLCVEDDLWVLEICTDNLDDESKGLTTFILDLNFSFMFVKGRVYFKNAGIPFWMA